MLEGQLIITVGREFGSGGHEIAQKLADHYEVSLYDHNLLDEIALGRNVDGKLLAEFDEVKKRIGLSRTVRGMSSSPEQSVAELQFEFLREKAEAGESFVVVGRCAETVLKEHPAMVSIFVLADNDAKRERVARIYELTPDKAEKLMAEKDKKRKKYHNNYCPVKWGDSRNYEISINSSKLGIDRTVSQLISYIDERMKK